MNTNNVSNSCLVVGIVLVSQLVLVFLFMLDFGQLDFAKIAAVHSRLNKNRSSGTHCLVTLFKAKVISSVKVYQFSEHSMQLCGKVKCISNIVFDL